MERIRKKSGKKGEKYRKKIIMEEKGGEVNEKRRKERKKENKGRGREIN